MKPQDGSLGANTDSSKSASDAPVSEAQQVPERLTRPSVPALDTILGQPFRVLDDGFVRLLDYMGNDAAVVQAARSLIRSWDQACARGPWPHSVSHATLAHHAIRDV